MKGQTEKALKSKGMSAGSFLASTGISPLSSANAIASKPTFPKPVSVGAKAVGWIEAEIDAWLTAQVKKSRRA